MSVNAVKGGHRDSGENSSTPPPSVFWQDYITFGSLPSYLRKRRQARIAIPLVAIMFYPGHGLLIPDRFAPIQRHGTAFAIFGAQRDGHRCRGK